MEIFSNIHKKLQIDKNNLVFVAHSIASVSGCVRSVVPYSKVFFIAGNFGGLVIKSFFCTS